MSAPPARRPVGRPPLEAGSRSLEFRFSLPERHARALTGIALAESLTDAEVCRRAVLTFLRNRQRTQARLARRVQVVRGRIGL